MALGMEPRGSCLAGECFWLVTSVMPTVVNGPWSDVID